MFTNLKVLLGTVYWSPTIETVESRSIGESLSPSLDIAINRMVERENNAIIEHLLQRSYHQIHINSHSTRYRDSTVSMGGIGSLTPLILYYF